MFDELYCQSVPLPSKKVVKSVKTEEDLRWLMAMK